MTTGPVLVMGATGFIGGALVRRLLAAGRPLVALARARDGASAGARVRAGLAPATLSAETVHALIDRALVGADAPVGAVASA